jgi:streptogramin lyase
MRLIRAAIVMASFAACAGLPATATAIVGDADVVITQWGSGAGPIPRSLEVGPDGSVWVTTQEPGNVWHFTADGQRTVFWLPTGYDYGTILGFGADGSPWYSMRPMGPSEPDQARNVHMSLDGQTTVQTLDLPIGPIGLLGPDGRLWSAGSNATVVRTDPATAATTTFPIGADARSLVNGPDGNLWFAESGVPHVGRLTRSLDYTAFPIPAGHEAAAIVPGLDGLFWVLLAVPGASPDGIVRMDQAGNVVATVPMRGPVPRRIAAGADGNIWGTAPNAQLRVVRISPTGTYTAIRGTLTGAAQAITTGPDGSLFIIESSYQVGRIDPVGPSVPTASPSVVTEHGVVLTAQSSPRGVTSQVHFEYGPTTAYGTATPPVPAGDGDDEVLTTTAVDGLAPRTVYHARAVVTSPMGPRYGKDISFTTAAAKAPPDEGDGGNGGDDDVVVDGDHDGFPAGVDCDDRNPAIHPGAADTPGDTIDQDCSGTTATWPRYEPHPEVRWSVRGKGIVFTRFALDRVPAGTTVTLTCRGPGCAFKRKVVTTAKTVRHKSLLAHLRGSRLRRGSVIELRAIQPGHVSRVIRWTIGRSSPRQAILCVRPDAKKPEPCATT